MSEEVRFYKGKYRVKILSKSQANWLVEALEPFEDEVFGEAARVETHERRFVAPNLLFVKKGLGPPFKEHTYELKMERKLKRLIKREENKKS
jgi:hypothetical protein